MQKAVYRWALDPEDRDAVILHVAIKKTPVPDYRAIAEISVTSSHEELLAIKRAYQNRYKHSLEEDLAQRTTGHLRTVCITSINISPSKNYKFIFLINIRSKFILLISTNKI